jgi:hypothetical protein
VITIDGGIVADHCIGEALGLLFCDENLDILAQRPSGESGERFSE